MVTDCVVIGAGLSGLSAAMLLVEQGYGVVVLEVRDRVGGRTFTIRDESCGGYSDLGGAYVGPTQRRVTRLAKRFGLEFYKVDVERKAVINFADKRYECGGTVPPIYNPITALDANNIQRTLQAMSKLVPADAPWSAKNAQQWDAITLKEFVDRTCWSEFGRRMMAYVCRAVLCVEMHEVSLLAFLWYMSSGQGFQRVVNVTNGAQESKFVGGSQRLSESMAAFLGDRVRLSSAVVRVDQTQDLLIKVHTSEGEIFESRYVISAVPMALLNRINFEPSLPANKLQLIQRIPMGSIIKTLTFYDKQYWKLKGLSGQMETDNGPIMDCYDDTKPDGSAPCLMGFILANQARHMACMTPDERRRAVADHYAEKFQCPELRHPINYVEKNWCADEYSGGCYVSTFAPGVLTQFGPELRRPFHRVYIAGTESATYWAGYMEGAIQAGERAAREVLNAMGRIPASEIWQDEPQLAEFPEPPMESSFFENILPTVPKFLAGCITVTAGTIALGISKIASRL